MSSGQHQTASAGLTLLEKTGSMMPTRSACLAPCGVNASLTDLTATCEQWGRNGIVFWAKVGAILQKVWLLHFLCEG